jgi:hypothetical protein
MARFRPRGLRPGTEDYKRKRRGWLNQQRALAEANAARASAARVKRPDVIRRTKRRASVARTEIKKIDTREEIRQSLTGDALTAFNRSTLRQQDIELLVRRIDREFPNATYYASGKIEHTGVPKDIPDPFAIIDGPQGPRRGQAWRLLYSRQGARRRYSA